ncbi:hypothetical protein [uncultured Pedobacter sp.]|uniref:hypothetical protein n=1 Tax=uncultured Pedobacter sp. TaxID=246139 RepID=UPI0026094F72|nr:hypothetical protein [uncultured Pedobacter sp.]
MSTKIRQSITKCLLKIANGSYDEETVRALLIIAREHIKPNGLIRELAHFIAHTDRDQGMFHKWVNNRYAKMKLVEDQLKNIAENLTDKNIATEDELSDFMLSGVDLHKIPTKLFNILYVDGLSEITEEHLQKYAGVTKVQFTKWMKEFYVSPKDDGFQYLRTGKSRAMIKAAIANRHLLSTADRAKLDIDIKEQQENINRIETRIDTMQKVVRGVITYEPVFHTATFRHEIEEMLIMLINKFSISPSFLEEARREFDGILLCVLALLHDSKFHYFDGAQSRNYLGFYHEIDRTQVDQDLLYNTGTLALFTEGARTTFPLFVSDLKISDYLEQAEFAPKKFKNFAESPWITAGRKEGILKLMDEDLNQPTAIT